MTGSLPRCRLTSARVSLAGSWISQVTAHAECIAAEDRLGRLLPGHAADFILVRDDYFEVPEAGIWNNRVLSTWVAGKKVYDAGGR